MIESANVAVAMTNSPVEVDGSVDFDVAICGAGLAGLTLARQLHLKRPELKVVLIDAQDTEIPKAAWKVGESSVEFGAHYLRDHLKLEEYLEQSHLAKRGLRFFFGNVNGAIEDRPEFGSAAPSPFVTYQLDRGILERDLRILSRSSGHTLLDGRHIIHIDIGPGDVPHKVHYRSDSGEKSTLSCRWLVDASGRRRLIQSKLDLSLPSKGESFSSAWFRMPGKVDIDDLVEKSAVDWHARVPGEKRHLSTNHFVGKGYWVWFIPLSGDATSIGIVCKDEIHPFNSYNTHEKALAWLEKHEPRLAEFLAARTPLDFKVMRQYSYTSKRIFSPDRWSCVGEAAVFADPFYSPGLDFIGMTNTITVDMIGRDLAGTLQPAQVEVYSRYVILLNDQITRFTQHAYDYFTDEVVTAARVLWDVSAAWGYMCPQFFNYVLIDSEKQAALRKVTNTSYFLLATKMYSLLDQWLEARRQGRGQFTYSFFNYLSLRWLLDFRKGNLQEHESIDNLCAQHEKNMLFFEQLIMALFYLAAEDVHPDQFPRLANARRFDIGRLSLDPESWDQIVVADEQRHEPGFRAICSEIKGKFHSRKNHHR